MNGLIVILAQTEPKQIHIFSMIYNVTDMQFKKYLRPLTKAERVRNVYESTLAKKACQHLREEIQEETLYWPDWETKKAELFVEMYEARKDIEFAKWRQRQNSER